MGYQSDMLPRFALNRMDMFGLLAVGVTTFLFLGAALNAAGAYMSVRHMSAGDLAKGCSGWLIATFGPILLAIIFWRCTKKLQTAWILHLLMLPLSLAIFNVGDAIMLSVAGTHDFDDTIGGPILQAFALLLLAAIGYYSAVLFTTVRQWSAAGNGG